MLFPPLPITDKRGLVGAFPRKFKKIHLYLIGKGGFLVIYLSS